jgi:hypothetical protein
MAGDFDFLKDLGFSPDDFKGKSQAQALDFIEKKAKTQKKVVIEESKKELFDNAKTKFPAFKKELETSFQVYAKKSASTGPKLFNVVGYDPISKEVILTADGNSFTYVKETALIKSEREFEEAKPAKKETTTPRKKKG